MDRCLTVDFCWGTVARVFYSVILVMSLLSMYYVGVPRKG